MTQHHILIIGENVESHEAHFATEFVVHKLCDKADKDAYIAEIADKIEGLALSGGADPKGNKGLLDRLPKLSIVATLGVGIGPGAGIVDIDETKRRGIVTTYGPGSNSSSVADLALAFMLDLSRRVTHFDAYTRAGHWGETGSKGGYTSTPTGKTVGILGLGNIGRAVARRCEGFDMAVAYHQRTRNAALPYRYCGSVRELAEVADYLVIAVPDAPETRGMVDAAALKALGPNGYLINVARGSVVDEDALVAALKNGEIAGAGLDVFRNEPKVQADLLKLENVILSPHRAAFTVESTTTMRDMMMANLTAHFAGREVPNPIPGFEEIARGRR